MSATTEVIETMRKFCFSLLIALIVVGFVFVVPALAVAPNGSVPCCL